MFTVLKSALVNGYSMRSSMDKIITRAPLLFQVNMLDVGKTLLGVFLDNCGQLPVPPKS